MLMVGGGRHAQGPTDRLASPPGRARRGPGRGDCDARASPPAPRQSCRQPQPADRLGHQRGTRTADESSAQARDARAPTRSPSWETRVVAAHGCRSAAAHGGETSVTASQPRACPPLSRRFPRAYRYPHRRRSRAAALRVRRGVRLDLPAHGARGARRPRSHRVQEPERRGARSGQRADGWARRGQRPERRPRGSRRRRRVLDTPGHSLAVFATPSGARTFQVADHLSPIVEVSDRFHVKPLLRSATFPQAAYVLAPVLATGRGGTQAAPLRPRPAADPGGDRDLSRTVSAPRRMGNRAHRPPQRRSAVLSDWARSEAEKTTKRTGSRRDRRRSRTPIRRGGAPRGVSWPRVAHSGG